MAQTALEETKDFKEHLPLIHILCNPGLRQRHWDKVCTSVNFLLEYFIYCTMLLEQIKGFYHGIFLLVGSYTMLSLKIFI